MVEKASLEFRLRKIDEPRRHPLDEIKYNDLMKSLCFNFYICFIS